MSRLLSPAAALESRRSGRRLATIYTWAGLLPLGRRCLAITVGGNHDVGIGAGEGFTPDCRTCDWTGDSRDTPFEAAEALVTHTEGG